MTDKSVEHVWTVVYEILAIFVLGKYITNTE